MGQAYAGSVIVLLALFGLVVSNLLRDRGVDRDLACRVPGVLGGVAFLMAVVWLDPWPAVALSGSLTVTIAALRLGFRRGLRGVQGTLPTQAWAEITYPLAGTASLAVGWGLLGDKWLAFVPIAFMAWGDSASGLTRYAVIRRGRAMGWRPSIAMLLACLAAAALFEPYWIGAVGAVIGTAAERFRPTSGPLGDDNLAVVAASLAIMSLLAETVS